MPRREEAQKKVKMHKSNAESVSRSGKLDERDSSSEQIRTLLEEQRQTTIAGYLGGVGHHELQAAHAERRAPTSTRRIMATRNWNFAKLINKVSQRWRNYENSRVRPSMRSRDESSSRIRTLFWNSLAEYSMNDSKVFEDAESIRSGNSHVTSRPVSFPLHPIPEGMLRHSFVTPSRREGPPSIWDTHGISGNVFANPDAPSSAPYPQELNQWNSSIEEPLHTSTVEKSERPEQNQDLRCQSGPSAKRFSHLQWRRLFKESWGRPTTTADFRSSFRQIPYTSNVVCWKIRFKTEVCTCSQFLTGAMLWIREVEMVGSVDDLKIFVLCKRTSNAEFLKYLMRGLLQH